MFEDDQGGLIDEEGAELMEVDEVDIQVMKLVSMERWWNQYKNDPDSFFVLKTRGDRKKLGKEHSDFLIDLKLESQQFITLLPKTWDLRSKELLSIALKNDEGNIEARYEWVKRVAETDMSFLRSCLFIDESGLHINMNRSGTWAPKGETPIVKAKNTRAVSHTFWVLFQHMQS
ncbi:hypothetical protein EDC96DRAFT_595891 [Choanephora cucurbitarum]|nr:hypothetical protein EDC96DRAFT_595891 [Choanephora cucurbitarum]